MGEIVQEGAIQSIADQSDEVVDHTISKLESKEKILEATEVDKEQQETILNLEEKRKEEILKQAAERNKTEEPMSDVDRTAEHDIEKEKLLKKQHEEREEKLKAMLRLGSLDADDFDSLDEKNLIILYNNRFTACVRRESVRLRIAMYALKIQFAKEENAIYSESAKDKWSYPQLLEKLLKMYSDHERRAENHLNVHRGLRREAEASEDALRDAWIKDTSKGDVKKEVVLFKAQNTEAFDELRSSLNAAMAEAKEVVEAECALLEARDLSDERRAVVTSRDPAVLNQYIECVQAAMASRKESVAIQNSAELDKFLLQEKEINDITMNSTSYGRGLDYREKQRNLHSRVQIGLQIALDADLRLVQAENDLRSESAEMKLIGELNSKNSG